MEKRTFLHRDDNAEMPLERYVGGMAVAICPLNKKEGRQPGETVPIPPIAAYVLVPEKFHVLLLGFVSGCRGLLAACSGCGGLQGPSERPFNAAQLLRERR